MAKKATNLGQIGEGFEDVMGILVSPKSKREEIIEVIYGSADKPLRIGEVEIPCYVLKNGERVISGRGMQVALGFSRDSSGSALLNLLHGKKLANITNKNLPGLFERRIAFRRPDSYGSVQVTYGYEATILVEIAKLFIEADDGGLLTKTQSKYADYSRILLNATAKVGIIGLIDEVTGYQEVRAKDALQGLLDLYIKSELGEWMKRFPDEYYKQIFRLRRWDYTEESIKRRPGVIGHWTKDIVYSRIAPGLLEELEKKNPKGISGRRKNRHHQFLTDDVGHPELAKHLHMVIALMRASDNWDSFYTNLEKALPKKIDAKQFLLGFEDIDD